MRVGGIVLCGGRSTRMGSPKAWLPVGDEVLLQRTVRVVGAVGSPVVVVAAVGQTVPTLPAGVLVVRDEVEGNGPLAGLAAGLAALDGQADAAYLSACDVPLLSEAFVRRMVELSDGAACVPEVDGRVHPLAGVYAVSLLPVVRDRLAAGALRMTDFLAAVDTRYVGPADLMNHVDSLQNVNTPGDYARIRERLG